MDKASKKRKLAKNKKKTWRSTDINDVEKFLENNLQEERIGSVAAKDDNELFTVDTSSVGDTKNIPIKLRRKLNALKPPRCFSGLENTSKVKDPLTNRVILKQKKNVSKLKGIGQMSRISGNGSPAKHKKSEPIVADLWCDNVPILEREAKKNSMQNDWFSEELVDHHLKGTGTNLRRVPGTARKKTTKLDPIATPHPGTSYNPSLKAHTQLIADVLKREQKIITQDDHLQRVVGDILKKVPADKHDREYLAELSAGLPVPLNPDPLYETDSEEVADGTVAEYSTLNQPVEVKRKARAARRKQKEERAKELAREKAKTERKVLADIDRVRNLKTNLVKMEMKMANRRNKEAKLEKEKAFGAIRLARLKFVEPDEELVMPSDLSGSLRTLKPQGSIIRDRFASLQKRNILAPNKAQGVRKRSKVKSYIRNTHKGHLEKTPRKKM